MLRYADKTILELRAEEATLMHVLRTSTLPASNVRIMTDVSDLRARIGEIRQAIGPRLVSDRGLR